MNATTKPGVLAVMDPAAELNVKQSGKNANAGFVDMRDWFAYVGRMKEARAAVERMAQTLAFIEINASAGELSAEGCAIQARAALAAFRGEA